MHAFLIVGNNINAIKVKTEELAKESHAKILEYPLIKIEDVRDLNNFLRLSITEPTLIVVNNIHETGIEALNAFLKNLEEPQPDLYFVLTTPSTRKVLPTIVSRCQIIKLPITNFQFSMNDEINNFLNMDTKQRIEFNDKIKDRSKAIEFVESLIFFLHEKRDLENMELLLKTLTRLKANGNISLQMTNLIVRMNI